jgi:hypothetical protein
MTYLSSLDVLLNLYAKFEGRVLKNIKILFLICCLWPEADLNVLYPAQQHAMSLLGARSLRTRIGIMAFQFLALGTLNLTQAQEQCIVLPLAKAIAPPCL